MSYSDWTRQKKLKLIDLYRQTPILWARRGTKVHPRERSTALQQIADTIGVNVLEVEKKLHVLRSQYMRERKRVLKSQNEGGEIYQSHWQFYTKLQFLSSPVQPSTFNRGRKSNSNSEHVSSNGDIERSEEDTPTQPNSHTIKIEPSDETIPDETFTGEPHTREDRIIPDDDSTITNHLSEIDVDIQNGSDFPTSRHESMASVRNLLLEQQDPNVRNFPSRGAYDTLTSFTNYLGSLLRHLPLEKCLQLQQKIINLTMNEMNESQQENGNVNLFNQADNRRNRVVPEISIETEPVDVVQGFGVCSENRGMSVQARMHRKSLPSKAPQKRNYSTIQPDAQRESSNREDVPWKRLCQGNQYFD